MCVWNCSAQKVEDTRTALRMIWEEQLSVLKDTFSEAQTILEPHMHFWMAWVFWESVSAQEQSSRYVWVFLITEHI